MYDRSAAAIYDAMNRGAGKDYGAEAAAVTEAVLARRPEARTLLDVACGTGEHLSHLRHRFEVEGLELSEHMAAIARTKLGPDIPIHAGDMRSFDLGRTFDAVTCMFSSIGYARDALQLGRAIGSMAQHLVPGGVLVFDAWLLPEQWLDGHRRAFAVNEEDLTLTRLDTSHRHGPHERARLPLRGGHGRRRRPLHRAARAHHAHRRGVRGRARRGRLRGRAGARPPGRPLALRGRPVRLRA